MSSTYTRNSNRISSKNISFNKSAAPTSGAANTLNSKQDTLAKQLEILENQHQQILAQAESDRQRMIDDAKKQSLDIERSAYEEGYSQGLKNGQEDGYKDAYEKATEQATLEFESKIKEATDILLSSKSFLTDMAISKKSDIINLSIAIAEKVLLREFEDKDSLNNIFETVLLEIKDKKSLVIKVNPLHKESIEKQIRDLKDEYSLTDDIHVMGLSSIDKGNALIETENGEISVGLEVALESIKTELL